MDISPAEILKALRAHTTRYPAQNHLRKSPAPVQEEYEVYESRGEIGIIILATKEYKQFIKPFWESIEEHFMPLYTKTLICFTDSQDYPLPEDTNRFIIDPLGWPEIILHRYELILSQDYSMFDQIYNFDVDVIFQKTFHDYNIFGELPYEHELKEIKATLVGLQSPLNDTKIWGYSAQEHFETNPESLSYLAPEERKTYYSASMTGGDTQYYLDVIREVQLMLDLDIENGLTPKSEEIALNKMFFLHSPTMSLPHTTMSLEGVPPLDGYILSRNKPQLDAVK